jgi:hypothetical protein
MYQYQCCRSGINILNPKFSFPDPGSKRLRIPDLGSKRFRIRSRIAEFKYGIMIRILIFYPSLISDLGVKEAPDPGSRSAILIRIYYNGCQDEVQVNYLWVHIILAFLLFPL